MRKLDFKIPKKAKQFCYSEMARKAWRELVKENVLCVKADGVSDELYKLGYVRGAKAMFKFMSGGRKR